MVHDIVPNFINRLRKKNKNDPNKRTADLNDKDVKAKKAHIWQRRKRHEEALERRIKTEVSVNKINPWFAKIHNPRGYCITALFDFPENDDIDESACRCVKGDKLSVESDRTGAWWDVINLRTEQRGFIPVNLITEEQNIDNILNAWHDIDRKESEAKLCMNGLPKGTYIFRPSSNSLWITLSVLCSSGKNPSVKHFKVENDDNVGGYFITPFKPFKNIDDLVSYYKKESISPACILSEPWPRKELPAIQSRTEEIKRKCILIDEKFDKGLFGSTHLGRFNGTKIAVEKIISPTSSVTEGLKQTHRLFHDRIVRTLGICSKTSSKPLLWVTEYMPGGTLKDRLLSEAEPQTSYNGLVKLIFQVVEGMDYLEAHNVVHGDLRAANVFISQENTAKVGNFGLSSISDEQFVAERKKAALRWAAPEISNAGYKFHSSYDVWSFAVLMYEVFTKGSTPYEHLKDHEILPKLEKGYRLPKPSSQGHHCEKVMEEMMDKCMSQHPDIRPSFRSILCTFEDLLLDVNSRYEVLKK